MRTIEQFNLYASCIPVKGAMRSVIYDLERNRFDLIPNILYHLLKEKNKEKKAEILNKIPEDVQDEYFEFLNGKDYLLSERCAEDSCLTPLDLSWDYPAKITNAVLFLNDISDYLSKDLLDQFEDNGCCHYQIIIKSQMSPENVTQLLSLFKARLTKKIELFLPYNQGIEQLANAGFFAQYPYCQTLVMYNSPYNKTTKGSFYYLIFTEGKLYDSPGNYSLFFPTATHFAEAQSHNTYFNRKVIIDEKGGYVLGVHESSRYGNVKELGLDELVSSADYTQYWKVNKDKTEVCKDCEFRYMCIDSRIPLKNTATGLFYFNSECSYSPYTCKWDIKKIQIKEI
nr:grasp-with-spasm system SPASM domain peptide maturase [uncultured Draconibacterium sp.]